MRLSAAVAPREFEEGIKGRAMMILKNVVSGVGGDGNGNEEVEEC
jgi:hypothetical protein